MAAQVFRRGVQVVDVDCQVLYPDVARSRELLSLVGRVELEELDVGTVGTAQKADGLDAAASRHAEPIPRGVIPWRLTLVEQLAAEHVDKERGRVLYVRHGDADVVYAAQSRQPRPFAGRRGRLIHLYLPSSLLRPILLPTGAAAGRQAGRTPNSSPDTS